MSYGRTVAGRANDPKAYCQSCTARLMIGEPVSSPSWSDHLLGQESDRKTRSTTHRHPDPLPYVSLSGMSRT